MSLYDDAGLISLPTGAAGKDGTLYNIKPEEKLKATELITNGNFSNPGPGTGGLVADTSADRENGWRYISSEGSVKIIDGVLKIINGSGETDVRAYATNGVDDGGPLESSKKYKVSYEVVYNDGVSATGFKYYNGAFRDAPSSVGSHSIVFTQGASTNNFIFQNTIASSEIHLDNVSVKEVEQEAKDFTFDRASNLTATRVGPGGLIEKGRENLITYSNDFSEWGVNTNVYNTPTTGHTGHDGSTNAWLINRTSTSVSYVGIPNDPMLSYSGVFTWSVYAKNKSGVDNGILLYTEVGEASFDLTGNGSLISETSTIDTNIESIGSGWFRCSFTASGTIDNDADGRPRFMVVDTSGNSASGEIYVQDAQLEAGLVATDYIESGDTTGKAGILEDEPRFDYTGGGCPGLLLESQSVNQIPHSEYFGSEWTKTKVDLDSNQVISPEGLKNASLIKVSDTTDSQHHILAADLDVTDDSKYAFSVFAKKKDFDVIALTFTATNSKFNSATAKFNITGSGSVVSTEANIDSASIEDFGNGWFRCIATAEAIATGNNAHCRIQLTDSTGDMQFPGTVGEGTYIYGAQFEESEFATSYIPNHGTSGGATRQRDDVGVLNDTTTDGLTNGYNTTIYCKFKLLADDRSTITGLVNYYVPISGLQNDPRMLLHTGDQANGKFTVKVQYRVGGVAAHDLLIQSHTNAANGYNVGDEVKAIARITDNDVTLFVNGTKFTHANNSDTLTAGRPFKKSLSGSTMNAIDLTYSANTAQHELYEVITFPKALTDDECIDLTT